MPRNQLITLLIRASNPEKIVGIPGRTWFYDHLPNWLRRDDKLETGMHLFLFLDRVMLIFAISCPRDLNRGRGWKTYNYPDNEYFLRALREMLDAG